GGCGADEKGVGGRGRPPPPPGSAAPAGPEFACSRPLKGYSSFITSGNAQSYPLGVQPMASRAAELLFRYLDVLDRHGAGSPEATAFLEAHRDDQLFVQLLRHIDRPDGDRRRGADGGGQ